MIMYAIVKTGGKQYRVERGQSLLVERLRASDGETVALEPLLLVDAPGAERDGSASTAGGEELLESKPRRRGRRGGRRRSAGKAEATSSTD